VHDDGSVIITPPPAYVGVPLSVVICLVTFVFLFRNKIVTGVGDAAGETVRLSWWAARKLKKLLESKQVKAWNAWHCPKCEALSTFEDVGVYCVQQNNGTIQYFLEGVCTRTKSKWARFITKETLAAAGVRVNLEPRLAAPPAPPPETCIDPRIHEGSKTSKFGGSMVKGFRISPDVANKMEVEWPTMENFANATQRQIKSWKRANDVSPSDKQLWFAATEMKKHLASDEVVRPRASPARR